MYKIILVLSFFLAIHFTGFGQFDVKSESQILEGIEWLNTNPVDETDSLFVVYVLDNTLYQMVTYPRFPMHFGALKDFMDHDMSYNYLDEINMVFAANMLANKIETGNRFNLQEASLLSMKKVLKYYQLLIAKDQGESNPVLEEYSALNDEEFEKKIKKLARK